MTIWTKNSRVISRILSLVLIVMLSCDSFNERDFIHTDKQVTFNENVFYILPGSSVVIDLNTTIKQSFSNASLSISQDPLRGKISQMDKQLLKYKPAAGFTQGEDEFIISVSNNSTFLKSDTVTIIMVQNEDDLPCAYAIGDKAQVKPGSPTAVSFLENDRICGKGTTQVSIQINPQFGEAMLIGDSVIVYTPGATFIGRDQLVYKLSPSSDEAISYGTIVFSDRKIQTLKAPYNLSSIFFVDESIGFLGGNRIYKTVDGGETWDTLSAPPFDPYEYCHFPDLFFLDANNGFAAYSSCVENVSSGGLISTTDGGLSWKKLNIDQPISHVFFTSATTGSVGVSILTEDERQITKIFKTEDGGSSWRETFTSPDNTDKNYVWGPRFAIQFINSSNGYALQTEYLPRDWDGESRMDKIFMTTDAGESWTLATSKKHINSIALAPENIVTAVFAGQDNSIVRSQDAATWDNVANYPYGIYLNKFSPSGNLGIAVGMINGPTSFDTLSQIITINRSIDKGATWVEDELDEPLYGFPWLIAVPSNNVAYVVCSMGVRLKIIKYTR